MKFRWKCFMISFFIIYFVITLYAGYGLYSRDQNGAFQDGKYVPVILKPVLKVNETSKFTQTVSSNHKELEPPHYNVEIWGKAAIGVYLWKHILNGELEELEDGFIKQGKLIFQHITFTFRMGPGIMQTTVPSDVQYLVLVLNGRSRSKIVAAKLWLDYLPMYEALIHVAAIVLGDEACNNDWLLPYMRSRGGQLDAAFLVYDFSLVDNVEFYQWPLGVATYRGFPDIAPEQVDLTSSRSHLCNFLGTVYENSTRQVLTNVVKTADLEDECIILGRNKWLPLENEDSLNTYIMSLLKSDLTLSPVGMNTECYRIYEAMSLGSMPVVEDVVTSGNCDRTGVAPLRLLKQYGAPFIYVKSWHELPALLHHETQLTLEEKVERRIAVVEWYTNFKKSIGHKFISVIEDKFFNINREVS